MSAAGAAQALRQVYAIARADLLERMRRFSYLATLAGTLYFVYLVHSGNVRLIIHGQRGIFNSAWIGTLIALSVGTLLSLIGFYLVKNTLDHDRRSGVGEILAATPLSRAAYTTGKALSNFLLLASILALLAVAAGITQLLVREESRLDLLALLAPLAALSAPPLALAAALAVLFEAVRWLRGALGNVVFFFLWTAGLSLSAIGPGGDLLGLHLVERSFAQQLPAATAAAPGGLTLNIGPADGGEAGDSRDGGTARPAGVAPPPATSGPPASVGRWPAAPRRGGVRWGGVAWTAAILGGRLAWFGIAIAIALSAALPFSRFDPARERGRGARSGRRASAPAASGTPMLEPAAESPASPAASEGPAASARAASPDRPGGDGPPAAAHRWRDLAGRMPGASALALVAAELRLMLRGRGFWWFAVAAGLCIAGAAVPAGQARTILLGLAWIWPLPLWSEMGAREERYGTRMLILSAPLPPVLQCAAAWAAGAVVTALAGSGVGWRLALAGDGAALVGWCGACLFIPALALALGTVSGSPRLFEVVYLLLWYAGPMNGVAILDYTGTTGATRGAAVPWTFLALAPALFLVAWAVRSRPTR